MAESQPPPPPPPLEDFAPEYVAFDQGKVIYSSMAIMTAMATCAVGLRFWARKERCAGLRLDDWLILAALVGSYHFRDWISC